MNEKASSRSEKQMGYYHLNERKDWDGAAYQPVPEAYEMKTGWLAQKSIITKH